MIAAALSAPAPAPAIDLAWSAPPSCPDRDAALARLRDAADTSRRLTARATLTRDAQTSAWSLRLSTDDGSVSSERELTAPSCDDLTDAAVLLLALALDVIEADAPPTITPHPGAAPVITRDLRTRARTRGGVRASVGVLVGLLPDPSLAASLRAWVARGRWRFEIAAAALPSQTVSLADGASASLRASLVGLRACHALTRAPFELSACGGADIGVIQGRGAGVLHPSVGASTAASLTAGATLAWRPARSVAAVASIEGAWTFDRPRFVILGVGDVHQPAPVGLAAFVGAEASW